MMPAGARTAPCGRPADGSAQDGFVLPSVLGLLVVISATLATVLIRVDTGTALSRVTAELVPLQGQADGLARLVGHDLLLQRTYRMRGLGLPEDGTPVACPLADGATALVSLEDQGLLVDLNKAPRPLLEEVMRDLGVPDRTALTLAAEILDDRDPDDVPEPNGGAETPQYRARGLPYGPRNAPFVSIDEIDRLPSMTPALAAVIKPALTVFNEGGQVDVPALVARLRPNATRSTDGQARPVPSPRQYFRIAAVVESRGARAGRSGVYGLGGTRTGVSFLEWRQAVDLSAGARSGHPACATIAAVLGG